jgi:CheY-like chemotaxis protein
MLRDTLQVLGHRVTEAANGREGLERLKDRPPDFVMCDIIMPDAGWHRDAAGYPKNPPPPQGHRHVRRRSGRCDYLHMARQLGAASMLAKPFSTDELKLAIAAVQAIG